MSKTTTPKPVDPRVQEFVEQHLQEFEKRLKKEKKKGKKSNPQLLVIESAIEDLNNLDNYVNVVLASSEDTDKRVTDLRTRNQALMQVLRRGNYYRNMNSYLLSIFFEIPMLAEAALANKDSNAALELTRIWEEKAYDIFKECYPNYMSIYQMLLDSVARMKIIPMPGKYSYAGASFAGAGGEDFENVV